MTTEETEFILHTTCGTPQPFPYFRDRYALLLLAYGLQTQSRRIREVRQSPFGHLLQKPVIRPLMAHWGTHLPEAAALRDYLDEGSKLFLLTWDRWGAQYRKSRKVGWKQTSRPGWNLVLQLNFDWEHDIAYRTFYGQNQFGYAPFSYECHPAQSGRLQTLAWARLDLSLETGEVLIEEIQSDWLKEVRRIAHILTKEPDDDWINLASLRRYQQTLQPYYKLWEEAMLSAVLWMAKEELGLSTVYYHTYEGGLWMKGLTSDNGPPRSLYTQLPRRFGFALTEEAPRFLQNEPFLHRKLRRNTGLAWYRLALSAESKAQRVYANPATLGL
ncbi:hypothetical protein SAMN05421823_113130 [Catalinimonas alkaloidigena]|uniref:Uncharacterized protein n=1 Tax=Catalinimonas alkaloidigena TaxID=1075417 RepID=A0A1G9TAY1_9BACT|nr:hypothetical protein [Catalinimonas alkaloidigena]SDM44285.1 hypothetical protein SAMN05421823_113130 [Catalinimonas alkaloidigena]